LSAPKPFTYSLSTLSIKRLAALVVGLFVLLSGCAAHQRPIPDYKVQSKALKCVCEGYYPEFVVDKDLNCLAVKKGPIQLDTAYVNFLKRTGACKEFGKKRFGVK
jgi:hypothetical protein